MTRTNNRTASFRALRLGLLVGCATLGASAIFSFTAELHAVPITGDSGPGGVGTQDGNSDLFLWLRADRGISENDNAGFVSDWADFSGNNRNGEQTSTPNQPAFISSLPALNNRPVVRADDALDHHVDLDISGTAASDFTFFYALSPGTNSTNSYLLDRSGDNTSTRLITGYNGSGSSPGQPGYFHNGGWVRSSNAADTSTQQLTFVLDSSASDASRIYRDGTSLTLIETADYAQRNLNTAGIPGSAVSNFSGDYAEVAIFDTALDGTRQVIVENYMASLYGLTTAQDFYAGDTNGNGDYDLDVFGIGNDGTDVFDSTGSEGLGIEATGGTLDAGEFVLAGHSTASNGLTTADVNVDDQRWERVWYIDTNDNQVDATLGFGWSDSGLVVPFDAGFNTLYYSPTDPFFFSQLASASSISGDQVFFNLQAADFQTGYYTLGTAIPEPSSVLLLGVGVLALSAPARRRSQVRRRTAAVPAANHGLRS